MLLVGIREAKKKKEQHTYGLSMICTVSHFEKGDECDKAVAHHQDQRKKSYLYQEGHSLVKEFLLKQVSVYPRKLGEITKI